MSVSNNFGLISLYPFSLIQDPHHHGFHRGFGYVEFDTEEAATAAVVSMNRFDLGGQLLRVTKAISPPDGISTNPVVGHLPAATAVAAASVTAKLLSMEVEQVCVRFSSISLMLMLSPVCNYGSQSHRTIPAKIGSHAFFVSS